MTYTELKTKQEKEFNNFEGIFFAFSNDQFEKGMKKLGLTMDQVNQVVSIGGGGIVLKNRVDEFKAMFARHDAERAQIKIDLNLMLDALIYELNNHEYGYTGDIFPALEALDLKLEDVPADVLKEAKKIVNSYD